MTDPVNARTIAALQKMISEMQHLVDHPRMQQRNWVAKGQEWLPVLQNAIEDLQRYTSQQDLIIESVQALFSALQRVGLQVEKRDRSSWAYRWHGGPLTGAFPTRAVAVEAALRERVK